MSHKVINELVRTDSAFTRHQIAQAAARYSPNDTHLVGQLVAAQGPLTAFGQNAAGDTLYSTPEMIDLEKEMLSLAISLSKAGAPWLKSEHDKDEAFDAIQRKFNEKKGRSIQDKRESLERLFEAGQFVVVSGPPGSGKLNIAAAAGIIWQQRNAPGSGQIMVCATSEKVAEQTATRMGRYPFLSLTDLQERIADDVLGMGPNDLLVIEEAGLLDSKQFHTILKASQQKGFTILAIGDHWQLPPQGPGVPLRVFAQRLPVIKITGFFRQKDPEDKAASEALWEKQDGASVVEVYNRRGRVHFVDTKKIISHLDDTFLDFVKQGVAVPNIGILVQNRELIQDITKTIQNSALAIYTLYGAQGLNFDHTLAVISQPSSLEEGLACIGRHKLGGHVFVDRSVYADAAALAKAWSTPSNKWTTLDSVVK